MDKVYTVGNDVSSKNYEAWEFTLVEGVLSDFCSGRDECKDVIAVDVETRNHVAVLQMFHLLQLCVGDLCVVQE